MAGSKSVNGKSGSTSKPSGGQNSLCNSSCWGIVGAVVALIVSIRMATHTLPIALPPDTAVSLTTDGWEEYVQSHLAGHGYAHVKGLLNRTEASLLRRLAYNFCYGRQRKALPLSWGGYTVPGFLELPDFSPARYLLEDERIHTLLKAMFRDAKYRFASHNDIGCDFVGVWHKDILRGPQRKYQVHDVWTPDEEGEKHEIYKVLFYLEDHERDSTAIKVVPGSHLDRHVSIEEGYAVLHPVLGDAVVIDQRISHAGNSYYDAFGKGRIFMQVGFGKANRFTDEFEKGTIERQQGYQAKMLNTPKRSGVSARWEDAKFFTMGLIFTALPAEWLNFFADIDVKKYPMLGRSIFGSNAEAQATTEATS